MALTERQVHIIQYLFTGALANVEDLSIKYSVSARTIRSDLCNIQQFLNHYDVNLQTNQAAFYFLLCSGEKKSQILASKDFNQAFGSQREVLAALYLLIKNHTTYDELAEFLVISKQTLVRLFPAVINYLETLGLEILKEKGSGISIQIEEDKLRVAFVKLAANTFIEKFLPELYDLFNYELSTKADEIIASVSRVMDTQYARSSLVKLKIMFGLLRMQEYQITDELAYPSFKDSVMMSSDYALYDTAINKFHFDLYTKLYIIWIFMGSSLERPSDVVNTPSLSEHISHFLIERLDAVHHLESHEKESVLKGLQAHLNVALYRVTNHIPIENPVLDQVKLCIPLLFDFTKEQMKICQEQYKLEFDENELAYIAMYIASVYERSFNQVNKINVLIVCSFGTTTSAILKSRMQQLLPECSFFGPLSYIKANEYIPKHNIDLIISTHGGIGCCVPVIQVSPLLSRRDIDTVKAAVYQLFYIKMCKNFLASHTENDVFDAHSSTLSALIGTENIQLLEQVTSWERGIEIAAHPLVVSGGMEKRYIKRMISAVKEFGTYMVMTPETAYVHAGTDDGVIKDCASVLVLRKPVVFGDTNRKTVRTIIVIAVKSKENILLTNLARIFSNGSTQKVLTSANLSMDSIFNLKD